MQSFQFKQFTILQTPHVFKVGTDGVLLGALSHVENAENILEIGTGTGLISLMMAQRNLKAEIIALDFNREAVNLSTENFQNSPFRKRLRSKFQDYKTFETSEKYDLIISNPPYFEKNLSQKHILARQQTELTFRNLIEKSAKFLSENGLLSVIIPYESEAYFGNICLENNLYPTRKITIFGIKNSPPKRCVLEFGFKKKEIVESTFTIEVAPREYSQEYLELTHCFHAFEK